MKPILLIFTLLLTGFSLQAQDLKLGMPVSSSHRVGKGLLNKDGSLYVNSGKPVGIWDVESGKLIHELKHNEKSIRSLEFSSDQKYLLVHSVSFVTIWDVASGKLLKQYEFDFIRRSYFVSNNSILVQTARSNMLINFNADNSQNENTAIQNLPCPHNFNRTYHSSDFECKDNYIVFNRLGDRMLQYSGIVDREMAEFINPDTGESSYYYSQLYIDDSSNVTPYHLFYILDVANLNPIDTILINKNRAGKYTGAKFDSENHRLFITSQNATSVWDINKKAVVQEIDHDVLNFIKDSIRDYFMSQNQIFHLGYTNISIDSLMSRLEYSVSNVDYGSNCNYLFFQLEMTVWDGILEEDEDMSDDNYWDDIYSDLIGFDGSNQFVVFDVIKSEFIYHFQQNDLLGGLLVQDNYTSIIVQRYASGEEHTLYIFGDEITSHQISYEYSPLVHIDPTNNIIVYGGKYPSFHSLSNKNNTDHRKHKEDTYRSFINFISPFEDSVYLNEHMINLRNGNLIFEYLKKYPEAKRTSIDRESKITFDNRHFILTGYKSSIDLVERSNFHVLKNFEDSIDFDCLLCWEIRAISPTTPQIAISLNYDSTVLWNFESDKKLVIPHSIYNNFSAFFYDSNQFVTISDYHWHNNPDFISKACFELWDVKTGDLIRKKNIDVIDQCCVSNVAISSNQEQIVIASNYRLHFFDANLDYIQSSSSGIKEYVDGIIFNNDSKDVLVFTDNYIWVFDVATGSLKYKIIHDGDIESVVFSSDDKYIMSCGWDGKLNVWHSETGSLVIQYIYFNGDPEKWLHLHPSGLFDASPEAMDMMYWTKGLEVIEFSQLKERFYLPDLWKKVMSGDELPKVDFRKDFKLYPEVTVNVIDDNILSVDLMKRDGGYGAVKVLLNGKEISQDARGAKFDPTRDKQTLKIDIKNHPYLKNGENKITVYSYEENNYFRSRGVDNKIQIKKREHKPQFFAVVVGIGEYANDNINLKFPVADAKAISKAVSLGAQNLFQDRSHVYTLTSDGDKRPTKENIKAVFDEIAKKASSEDIILLYLAGHGVSTSGDQGDFYFLTADAMSANQEAYRDEQIRKSTTISTNEWVEWLKDIPISKQVMILDACGSGKAVDNLIAMRDIEPSQIKAIDRMRDRMGMYIISGCAADAVSYEASRYGQGLLTFALLEGIKGAAVGVENLVDVSTIFHYARERVPELAEDIGGVQKPQLLQPKGGSWAIGALSSQERDSIPLANLKTVYVRSSFQDFEEFDDILYLNELLDQRLSQISSRGADADLVFFDVRKFPGAYKLLGRYRTLNDKIHLSLKIRCGEDLKEHQIEAESKEELIDKIIELLD